MTASTLPRDEILLPQQPGGMRAGALLAIIVHLGLLLAIALGVRWHASQPEGMSAELWAAVPQAAAPAAVQPPPPPAPKPAPAPPPAPAPVPKPAPRAAPAEPSTKQADRDAQIAIEKEREKKRREEQAQREREQAQHEREQAAKEKAAKEKAAREKAEREQAAKERLERERAEAARAKAEKEKAERRQREEEQRLAKLREDNLQRMRVQIGATGGPSATGAAARDAGPSASYAGKVIAAVRPNIVFTESISGSVNADVQVVSSPDGTIVSRRLVKSSGNAEWDEAVLRALDRTRMMPRDVDGRVPSPIIINFKP
ncbi:MAG TPA: cell envelope integrity protein TolA [Burkholderiaceae bacterium]|nr:cell envelope integrity protein TolA [Burkholderiaceae bacterium]